MKRFTTSLIFLIVASLLQHDVALGGDSLPPFLLPVENARYAPLHDLYEGSQDAQERQLAAIKETFYPLEIKTKKTGIHFRLLPPGTFLMGSPSTEHGRDSDEDPQHQVTFTSPIYFCKYEITQSQWKAVVGHNPSYFKNSGPDAPVETVNWNDCQRFCLMLANREGAPADSFRLPTEAEWEYACRSGTMKPYAGKLEKVAWHDENSGEKTHMVGLKIPNAWGLFDMHGNVWEWCQDWYANTYPSGNVLNPTGPSRGEYRTLRGGGWNYLGLRCRSADRNYDVPEHCSMGNGFRIVIMPGQ